MSGCLECTPILFTLSLGPTQEPCLGIQVIRGRDSFTLKLHVPARQGPSVNITVVVTGHRTRRSPCPLAPARVSQTGLSQERHPGPPPPVQGKQLGEWEMGSEP